MSSMFSEDFDNAAKIYCSDSLGWLITVYYPDSYHAYDTIWMRLQETCCYGSIRFHGKFERIYFA